MITPNQVAELSLEEIIGDDREGRKELEYVQNLVATFFFSDFPERRKYAKHILDEFWETPIEIEKIEDEDIQYT
jgi:hypothetical protein